MEEYEAIEGTERNLETLEANAGTETVDEEEKIMPNDSVVSNDSGFPDLPPMARLPTEAEAEEMMTRSNVVIVEIYPWTKTIFYDLSNARSQPDPNKIILSTMSKLTMHVQGIMGCILKSVRVIRFAKYLARTLFLIADVYQDFTDSIREYHFKMSELLMLYTTMELKIASKCSSSRKEVADRLTYNFDYHFRKDNRKYIYKILSQVHLHFDQIDVLSKIYKKYVERPKMKTTLPDTMYVWYSLTLRRWKALETDYIEKEYINQLAMLTCPTEDFKNNPLYAPFIPPYNSVNEATSTIVNSVKLNQIKLLQAVLISTDSYHGSDEVIDLCDDGPESPIDVEVQITSTEDFPVPIESKEDVVATIDLTLEERIKQYEMGWLESFAEKALRAEIPANLNSGDNKLNGIETIDLSDIEEMHDDEYVENAIDFDQAVGGIPSNNSGHGDRNIIPENFGLDVIDVPIVNNVEAVQNSVENNLDVPMENDSEVGMMKSIEITLFSDPEMDTDTNKSDIFSILPIKTYQRKQPASDIIDIQAEPGSPVQVNVSEFMMLFSEEHSSPSRCSTPPESSPTRPISPPSIEVASVSSEKSETNKDNILFSGKLVSLKRDDKLQVKPSTSGTVIFSTGTSKPKSQICSDDSFLEKSCGNKKSSRVNLDILDENSKHSDEFLHVTASGFSNSLASSVSQVVQDKNTPIEGQQDSDDAAINDQNRKLLEAAAEAKRVSFIESTERQKYVRPMTSPIPSTINTDNNIQPIESTSYSVEDTSNNISDTSMPKSASSIPLIAPKADADLPQKKPYVRLMFGSGQLPFMVKKDPVICIQDRFEYTGTLALSENKKRISIPLQRQISKKKKLDVVDNDDVNLLNNFMKTNGRDTKLSSKCVVSLERIMNDQQENSVDLSTIRPVHKLMKVKHLGNIALKNKNCTENSIKNESVKLDIDEMHERILMRVTRKNRDSRKVTEKKRKASSSKKIDVKRRKSTYESSDLPLRKPIGRRRKTISTQRTACLNADTTHENDGLSQVVLSNPFSLSERNIYGEVTVACANPQWKSLRVRLKKFKISNKKESGEDGEVDCSLSNYGDYVPVVNEPIENEITHYSTEGTDEPMVSNFADDIEIGTFEFNDTPPFPAVIVNRNIDHGEGPSSRFEEFQCSKSDDDEDNTDSVESVFGSESSSSEQTVCGSGNVAENKVSSSQELQNLSKKEDPDCCGIQNNKIDTSRLPRTNRRKSVSHLTSNSVFIDELCDSTTKSVEVLKRSLRRSNSLPSRSRKRRGISESRPSISVSENDFVLPSELPKNDQVNFPERARLINFPGENVVGCSLRDRFASSGTRSPVDLSIRQVSRTYSSNGAPTNVFVPPDIEQMIDSDRNAPTNIALRQDSRKKRRRK